MIEKFFKIFYPIYLINIVTTKEELYIYIEKIYNNKIKDSDERKFVLNETFQSNFNKYIKQFFDDSPYTYVSLLNYSEDQGAFPTCEEKSIGLYRDISFTKYICIDNKWGVWTSTSQLNKIKKISDNVEADFIFSPVIVLYNFFNDKISFHKDTLYILVQKDFITITVFSNKELKFAEHISLYDLEDMLVENEEIEKEDEDIDLDDIDIDEDIEEFGDIEELENLDDISDDDILEEKLEESLEEIEDTPEKQTQSKDINNISNSLDYKIFTIIQKTVQKYYNDDLYESDFIESIYIADSLNAVSEIKKFIEEEMFLNVFIRKIDLLAEICELTKKELNYEI